MILKTDSVNSTMQLGQLIGTLLSGGEIIELIGDVGAGKTTFTKGLGVGLDIKEAISSPSFTISRAYNGRDDINLVHYDFYRLADAGIMRNELEDCVRDKQNVVIVEWSDVVKDFLPKDRLVIKINAIDDNCREIDICAYGAFSERILKGLRQ